MAEQEGLTIFHHNCIKANANCVKLMVRVPSTGVRVDSREAIDVILTVQK